MKKHEQTDSSNSEDEIPADILKEAADHELLNDDLYTTKKAKTVPLIGDIKTSKLNSKSLRPNAKQERFTIFGVTATFQNFIAKRLDEVLEVNIEFTNDETECCAQQQEHIDYGIKLLNSSKKFLTATELYAEPEKVHKKRKKNQQIKEDAESMSKFQEAAIEPECILNKSDTIAWASKRPLAEFNYKRLKNGVLVEQ